MEIFIKRKRSNNKNECFNLQFGDSIEFIPIMDTNTMQILIYMNLIKIKYIKEVE